MPSVDAGSNPLGYTLTGDIKNVGAYSFGLTYVKAVNTRFAIGGTMKYVTQMLGTKLSTPTGMLQIIMRERLLSI